MTTASTSVRIAARSVHRNMSVGLAQTPREILEAQKLRYSVFAGELGARLRTRIPQVDQDIFDPYCEHLVVRDENTGAVVGTYRILSGGLVCTPITAAAPPSPCCGRAWRATCCSTATTT